VRDGGDGPGAGRRRGAGRRATARAWVRRRFLRLLDRTLNRVTRRLAHAGRGPFSIVRHVGRRTGRSYETPLILARHPDGFVAELTYGDGVSWYRNIVAAGGCVVVHGGREHHVVGIEPCSVPDGLRAFGHPQALVLRLLRRREFRLLRVGTPR
jgi:deazaflavin-dependent oxidoreductase (nitroreductase family)